MTFISSHLISSCFFFFSKKAANKKHFFAIAPQLEPFLYHTSSVLRSNVVQAILLSATNGFSSFLHFFSLFSFAFP